MTLAAGLCTIRDQNYALLAIPHTINANHYSPCTFVSTTTAGQILARFRGARSSRAATCLQPGQYTAEAAALSSVWDWPSVLALVVLSFRRDARLSAR